MRYLHLRPDLAGVLTNVGYTSKDLEEIDFTVAQFMDLFDEGGIENIVAHLSENFVPRSKRPAADKNRFYPDAEEIVTQLKNLRISFNSRFLSATMPTQQTNEQKLIRFNNMFHLIDQSKRIAFILTVLTFCYNEVRIGERKLTNQESLNAAFVACLSFSGESAFYSALIESTRISTVSRDHAIYAVLSEMRKQPKAYPKRASQMGTGLGLQQWSYSRATDLIDASISLTHNPFIMGSDAISILMNPVFQCAFHATEASYIPGFSKIIRTDVNEMIVRFLHLQMGTGYMIEYVSDFIPARTKSSFAQTFGKAFSLNESAMHKFAKTLKLGNRHLPNSSNQRTRI